MANFLSQLTMVKVPSPVAAAPAPAAEILANKKVSKAAAKTSSNEGRVSIFVNPKTVTYSVAVCLVKGAWAGFEKLPVEALHSVWVPFILCLVIGMTVAINNLQEEKLTKSMYVLGLVIGVINSSMMFAAVLGISK